MQTKKTNNSYLGNKVELRINNLPPGPLSVLDCYGGAGKIWTAIKQETGRSIRYIAIDKQDYNAGLYLPGDNMAYLRTIDLTRFNVVDVDAYGVPHEQLEAIFSRGFVGVVFVTFIQSLYGQLPAGMLERLGFTREMYERCPTIFGKTGWSFFLEYLAANGVRAVTHRSNARKHYLCFSSDAAQSSADWHSQAVKTVAGLS